MSKRVPASRTKPKWYRASKEKPFDPDVEFGGGVNTRGTSTQVHSKKLREARSNLHGPPLAVHRAQDAYRQVKNRALKQGITTEAMADEVGVPIGTSREDMTIVQKNKFYKLIDDYTTIKLCRRKVLIYSQWNALTPAHQRELLGLGPKEKIPVFTILAEETEMAWPSRQVLEIRIANPPFEGFDRNSYTFVTYTESQLANAARLADETTGYTIDTSDDDETVYTESEPLTDIEPVSYFNLYFRSQN